MSTTEMLQLLRDNMVVARCFTDGNDVLIHLYWHHGGGVMHVIYSSYASIPRLEVGLLSIAQYLEMFSSLGACHPAWLSPSGIIAVRARGREGIVIASCDPVFMKAYRKIAKRLRWFECGAGLRFTAFYAAQKLQWVGKPHQRAFTATSV